jgi:Flp pilus assembly protein TadB
MNRTEHPDAPLILRVYDRPAKLERSRPQPSTPAAPAAAPDAILSSPMSFTGSAQRIMRHAPTSTASPARRILVRTLLMLAVALAWAVVLVWYAVMLSFWLLPTIVWRFHRRGVRREREQARQHRELLEAVRHTPPEVR